MSEHDKNSLLRDLEDIRQSLDRIAQSEPAIPLLEEIVDKRTPTHVNPNNPFLSSQSLSELIRIRNEAEARAARELASLTPAKTHADEPKPDAAKQPASPDPADIQRQLEAVFNSWVDDAVGDCLDLFERELRHRLHQDFRTLVAQWFRQAGLPVPDDFAEAAATDREPLSRTRADPPDARR